MRRAAIVILVAVSCVIGFALPAGAAQEQRPVRLFADGSIVSGAGSTLTSNAGGASFTLRTSGLPVGHTVTVWWIVFNRAENCTHPTFDVQCGPGDLPPFGGDDSAVTSVLYAAGHTIGGSGSGGFAGHLSVGDTDGALFGPGLLEPTTAEIHLVVRDHGHLAPEQRAEGSHSFGVCNPSCTDVQFSEHQQ